MDTETFELDTHDHRVIDITERVQRFVRPGSDGLLNVFVPHATAGVAVIETGSGSELDLEDALERLLPRDDRYQHRHGSTGHGGDHVMPAFIAPSLTLPIVDGSIALGTWQRVVVVDPNHDNDVRSVRLSFVEG
ncbi:MAG TPA: secondary thiamine-phosphate synthase enzyme YjbQ [Actinomycetota bacterium]